MDDPEVTMHPLATVSPTAARCPLPAARCRCPLLPAPDPAAARCRCPLLPAPDPAAARCRRPCHLPLPLPLSLPLSLPLG